MNVFSYFLGIKQNMIRKDYEYEKVSSIIIYVLGYSGIVCTAIKAKQFHRYLQERCPYKDSKKM